MEIRKALQAALDYIEENLRAEITAAELAQQAGFSLFHFYRLFHREMGMPVMQYVLRRRLQYAAWEMRLGKTGVEAALEYGFLTYAGFYRAFRRELCQTPKEYIRKSRAKRPVKPDLLQEEYMELTQKTAAEVLRHWGMEGEQVTPVWYEHTGNKNENAVYVGESYVLKYSPNPGKLKNAMELAKQLENVGFSAAVPMAAQDGKTLVQHGELFFCLTRRLQGRQMVSPMFYAEDGAQLARFVGEVLGQLHTALKIADVEAGENDLLKTVREWALPKAAEVLQLPKSFQQQYLEKLEAVYPALPRQLIHRDPNPSNIILGKDCWGFIDFELSERNVRIFDPLYAATAILSETKDVEQFPLWLPVYQNILLGYHSVAKLSPQEKTACPLVLVANQLICVAYFAAQPKFEEVFAANKKMTLWLLQNMELLQVE